MPGALASTDHRAASRATRFAVAPACTGFDVVEVNDRDDGQADTIRQVTKALEHSRKQEATRLLDAAHQAYRTRSPEARALYEVLGRDEQSHIDYLNHIREDLFVLQFIMMEKT